MPNQTLTVGALSAAPGEKRYGVNEFPVQGQSYRLPMWLVNGASGGPTLVVTAGVHAAEYASIAAALDLGRALDPARLHGRVIVVPVMNGPAFTARSIYVCPLDGKNLNRVFPGEADGSASQQIAAWVFERVIRQGDYYIDLHGGDLVEALVPFTIFFRSGDARVDATAFELAKVFGIEYLVRSETPGSTFCAAARAGIPAILAESGGQGIWTPKDIGLLSNGIHRVMLHLGMCEGPAPDPAPFKLLDQFLWLRSAHDGFWYPSVPVGEMVRKGESLGCIKDVEGRVLQDAIAPADGCVLFIVTSLAINDNDPLLAVGA
jgi:predicted deacylase